MTYLAWRQMGKGILKVAEVPSDHKTWADLTGRERGLVVLVYLGVLCRDNVEKITRGFHGSYYVPGVLTLLFSLTDELDFLLDLNLSGKLFNRGHAVWGGLLIVTSIVCQGILLWSKHERNFKTGVAAENLGVFALMELVVFMLEDTTTIVVFTQVNGLFDPTDLFDVANLALTLASAAGCIAAAVAAVWGDVYVRDAMRCRLLPLVTSVMWTAYVAIRHVALDEQQSGPMNATIVGLYFLFLATGSTLTLYNASRSCRGMDVAYLARHRPTSPSDAVDDYFESGRAPINGGSDLLLRKPWRSLLTDAFPKEEWPSVLFSYTTNSTGKSAGGRGCGPWLTGFARRKSPRITRAKIPGLGIGKARGS
jgi:hypothetical protein